MTLHRLPAAPRHPGIATTLRDAPMVGRFLRRFGDILGSTVAAMLQLALTIVIGPIVLLLIGTDAALSIARREPRITLPSSV